MTGRLYEFSVDAVALAAATAKTVIEIGASANVRTELVEWWIEFDGVTPSAVPVKAEVGRFSAAVTTATTGTWAAVDPADSGTPASVVKHTTTVEGAGTIVAGSMIRRIPPTQGLWYQAPMGTERIIGLSGFWRIRLTAAAIVNVTCGVVIRE